MKKNIKSIFFGNNSFSYEGNTKEMQLYNIKYAAVYAVEKSKDMVDYFFAICPYPRIFEWNYLNHCLCANWAYDIDGVLCEDPTEEENDDGDKYRHFLLNAKPLYIPKFKIAVLCTSRLEKYRSETEAWLKNNDVQYGELYMLNLPSKEARIAQKAHTKVKIDIYKKRKDLTLFIESSSTQAELIAKTTHKDVICVENGRLYHGIS